MDVMNPALPALPLHMGGLHPYEQLIVLLVAFGPFVVLFVVVYVVRRRDLADEASEVEAADEEEGASGRRPARRDRRVPRS